MIGHLDKDIRPLILIMPKISEHVKTFKVHTKFCSLNVPEDDIECEYFTVISIGSLLVYENKYYLQVY